MDSIVFTPAALLDLLLQIDELSDYDMSITQTFDGQLQLIVGDSAYCIDSQNATNITVDDSIVDEVDDINEEAYENLDTSLEIDTYDGTEPIESGILKEIAKTLLIGGMVRLTKKLLK